MTPEKLFHELLGLGMNWAVKECEFDRESGVPGDLLLTTPRSLAGPDVGG